MRAARLCVALIVSCTACLALIDCDDVLRDAQTFAGKCDNKWRKLKPFLRPTQQQMGFAWVSEKLHKHYTSKSKAQKRLDDVPIPVVLGPFANGSAGPMFVLDHHHELAALDYSGYDDVKVTVHVLCDWRGLSEQRFWELMQQEQKVFLLAHPAAQPNVLPVAITPAQLPARFSFTKEENLFSDDPWRSLGSFVRKVEDDDCEDHGWDQYCQRCYVRKCNDAGEVIPFFEFQWAYFFNQVSVEPGWWPHQKQSIDFKQLYARLPNGVLKDNDDLELWRAAAESLVPLCRAESTAEYLLPSDKFSGGALPGYVQGHQPVPEDPECAPATCSATCSSPIHIETRAHATPRTVL